MLRSAHIGPTGVANRIALRLIWNLIRVAGVTRLSLDVILVRPAEETLVQLRSWVNCVPEHNIESYCPALAGRVAPPDGTRIPARINRVHEHRKLHAQH